MFTKLQKGTIRSVMSVCLSVDLSACPQWVDFHEISYEGFQKYVENIQI